MKAVFALAGLICAATPVWAQGTQPYDPYVQTFAWTGTKGNYCPAGTQPVVGLDGISCGVVGSTGNSGASVATPRVVVAPAPYLAPSGEEFMLGENLGK